MTIDSMIETAVIVFNEKLETLESPFRINPKPSIWNLYLSKKTGKPKQDLPALDRDNLLADSGSIDMFSLHSSNPNKLINASSHKWKEYKRRLDEGEEVNDFDDIADSIKEEDDDNDDDNYYDPKNK